jgi:hypothetical protein
MLKLPPDKQKLIVQGTGWNVPGQNDSFVAKYDGDKWNDRGYYVGGKQALSYYRGLVGDSSTDAPPPEGKKKRKPKGK